MSIIFYYAALVALAFGTIVAVFAMSYGLGGRRDHWSETLWERLFPAFIVVGFSVIVAGVFLLIGKGLS